MNSTESVVDFDLSPYTSAALRMEGIISYQGHTAEQVFGIMGDPECITDWYLLAKQVNMHPKVNGQEQTFNVEFTFFGDVFEEICTGIRHVAMSTWPRGQIFRLRITYPKLRFRRPDPIAG
jgi:hypothetical protein